MNNHKNARLTLQGRKLLVKRIQTNGKAERFIQTCLREWAYGRVWQHSQERATWLPAFLEYYNTRRPHSALANRPPVSRIGGNNLLRLNIYERVWRRRNKWLEEFF
jgi:hypothetical protein